MNGIICTRQDLERDNIHCLTRAESIDLTLLAVVGVASTLAVLWISLLLIRNVKRERDIGSGRRLIEQPMDVYMISLFLADLLHSLGSLMNIKWIVEGMSEPGTFCTTQGVLNHAGPVAVALNTIVITLVTFIGVWWRMGVPISRREQPRFHLRVAWFIVAVMWFLIGAFVGIPAAHHGKSSDPYWAPSPVWCTINKGYEVERLWAKYLWLWLACLISIVLYIPMAFWARGNITMDPSSWWKFSIHRRRGDAMERHPARRLFFGMMAYPLSNAILIIPLSIVRWIELTGPSHITPIDGIAVGLIFDFSGLTNVLLLLYIRPNLLLFGRDGIHCKHCQCTSPQTNSAEMVAIDAEGQGKLPFPDRVDKV